MKPKTEDKLFKMALWLEPVIVHAVKFSFTYFLLAVAEWLFIRPFASSECLIVVLTVFTLWVPIGKAKDE